MKVLKYSIGYAFVVSAIVLALDVIGMILMLFLVDIPAVVLDLKDVLHLSSVMFRWLVAIGSVTFLPGVIGWIIFFKNKDRIGTSKTGKDVK